jgi:fructokinase
MSEKTAQVWVAGEALIDLFQRGEARIPIVGGGPANTAKALARLGIATSFIGGISSDKYGQLIEDELTSYGVDLNLARRSSLETAMAVVTLNKSGSASYEFKLSDTATFDYGDWLPSGNPDVLHVGTLATIVEPGAGNLYEWARHLGTSIIFDPNVRVSVVSDRNKYRSAFEKWARISKIVKLSNEDLDWLGYSVNEIQDFGVEVVVVTSGETGLSGFSKASVVSIPGVKVDVVDTVGAGDTVGAVLVEGLLKYGESLIDNLEEVVRRAALAAAITCTREGAKPPSLDELDGWS